MNRRDFLKIVFKSAPGLALATYTTSPLANALWPEAKLALPKCAPFLVGIDDTGYLYEPGYNYDNCVLPSNAEHFDFSSMGDDEKLSFLVDWTGGEEYCCQLVDEVRDSDEYEEQGPTTEVTTAHLSILEEHQQQWLDEPVDSDYLSFQDSAENSEYWPGIDLLREIGECAARDLGLHLIEGECPGSSFCAVSFKGDVSALNDELFRRGINMQVAPAVTEKVAS